MRLIKGSLYYTLIVISFLSLRVLSQIKCNMYPYSPNGCIKKTERIRCQYDYFENKCSINTETKLGCSEYLNKEACLSQLTDSQNNRVQCLFQQKCQNVTIIQLQQYGCSEMFNKYACLNVEKQSCSWQNNRCEQLKQIMQDNINICDIFKTPVTPYTCSQLSSGLCMSSGQEGDYKCVEIQFQQLSYLSCYELGLNEEACLAINKENQYCIFQDNQCMQLQLSQIKQCNNKFSQSLCLSIKNIDIQCEWVDQKCRKFEYNSEFQCVTQNLVNVSVCQLSTGLCYYDENKNICMNIDKNLMNLIQCDTPGLSKLACLSIKNQKCSFTKGRCQELSELELNFYQCHMNLNKLACVNIQTSFQYCFWNGSNCERKVINQDFDCPLKFDNNNILVNGNVCSAISKYKTKCKYNQQTNLCIESSINDICETPYINKFGCLSIIKGEVACQWSAQGCKNVQVIQYQTTCASLGSANPIACSQVHEQEENVGCYFDDIQQQCVTLTVELNPNATKNEVKQYYKDLELLRNINCKDKQQGLSKITCSSITTKGVACMWHKNQCVQIENKKDIQTIPCLQLQYANYIACSYVQQGKEVCRYNNIIKGCVNSIVHNMQCNQLGLNPFGCAQAEGKCQFINDQCQNPDNLTQTEDNGPIDGPVSESPQTCAITSPSRAVCVSFSAISLLCQWDKAKMACEAVEIEFNQNCLEFAGNDKSVNSNVCASILSDFPDYDYLKGAQADKNRGYCYYNKQISQCQIKKELCNTKCCTEIENYGINAHSCSKYSSNEPGDYCFFMNLRCQELTNEIVDISDLNQIKQFYNENLLQCSSMNKNSCHMIDWSLSQLCYYNGIACLNLDFKYYKDYRIFTKDPSVLNENACFAINGLISEQNTLKYIGYDYVNMRCLEILLDSEFSYDTCEDAKGNRNICQRYTGNNYCKWDYQQLKCITIPFDEQDEIQSCDSELNIKACTDNKLGCLFSYDTDQCIRIKDNDFNVDCNHFQSLGKVSWNVCQQINKSGQQCEFQKYQCVDSTKISSNCDGSLANNRSCYKNTKGLCRWDPNTFQCFVNFTKIKELSCLDNINIELCKQITKEACVWDDVKNECEIFNTINSTDFEIFNNTGNHKFNEKACLLITGDAYYYDKVLQKCTKLTSKIVDCDTYQLNKYACLYHTRTHHCFYDEEEVIPNNKCKPFILDQSICQTKWLINIEMCMSIYHPCYFDVTTLSCQSFEFLEDMTCSSLQNLSVNLQHPNRRVCASVVQTLDQTIGELQCFEDKQNIQQCKFEKYCFWIDYSCQLFKIVYDNKESISGQQQTIKECPDFLKVDTCLDEVILNKSSLYSKQKTSQIESNWKQINETCHHHIIKYNREHSYYLLSDNSVVCQIKDCSIIEKIFCGGNEIIETIIPINEVTPDNYDSTINGIKVVTDVEDTCQNTDCTQLTEYVCNIEKSKCLRKNTCQPELIYPYTQPVENNCLLQNNYVLNHWCQLVENNIYICSKAFSKALCLELSPQCYYDLEQGGCRQLEGNEHNLLHCGQIANNCYVSSSYRAICQNGDISIKPGDKCKTVQKTYQSCVPLTKYVQPFSCSDILNTDAQPILCAKANDDCRYDGKVCINSMPTKTIDDKYPCDKSFSKSICEKCGCNYTYLGYCQKTKQLPQINSDESNKYFLCYQVNLLDTTYQQEICTSVDQACVYKDSNNCYDATHYSCSDLFQFAVSLKACLKCQENAVKYDAIQQKCLNIDNISNQTSCDNLNEYACLRKTEGVQCKWENFNCQTISIQSSDTIKCSILNQNGCYSKQVNICWIDQITTLCIDYDPYQGKCDLLKTESLCVRSMYENCIWSQNKCNKNSVIPINTCDNLNQYLCLNAINKACGWSDVYEKCYQLQFKSDPTSCYDFLQSEQSAFINRCNYYTCTQIKVQQGCIHDQYYRCREVIPTDILSCEVSSVSNINEYTCTKLTKGQCKFIDNACQKTSESNLGCQSYLNQQACLLQDGACKFDNYCQSYVIESIDDIKTLFPYTNSVCKAVDLVIKSPDENTEIGLSLIYSVAQQKCLDVTNKDMVINDCNYVGMNKYSCLLKTNLYCEFFGNQCRYVSSKVISSLKTCRSTLNQYACTKLSVQCKFLKGQCLPINDKDNCITLSQEKSIVNFRTCLKDTETPCMFNYNTQNCEVITTPQKCQGLNYKGCIFVTQGYNCEFKDSKCITSFGNRKCIDDINEEKCLSVITKGQYCYFDNKLGCKNIDVTKVNLNKCYKDELQTNPYTCSRSTDIPCFFDKQFKKCTRYTEQTSSSYQLNYNISNIYSFNKMTCQTFNEKKALMWQETCQIVQSSQLVYLKCSAILNKIACLSIKTPYQYCQYKDNKCINANLEDFKNVNCNTIIDINSGQFCALNINLPPCEFNKFLFRCQEIQSDKINCVEKDPEEKGYNKTCCELNKTNCIFDENCYKLIYSGYQFCRDIKPDSSFQCKQVTGEGCMIQSNTCTKIYYKDYTKIQCEQASNRFGCVNIQTNDQYCQFDGDQCKLEDVQQYREISCLSITNINHYSFCEQTLDISCTFDLKNNCCRNVYPQEEFSCERGLNKIACLNQTNKSLMCKFLQYCYGPNNGILNCDYNNKEICCREADSIDTCLNQKIYECEWTINGCQASPTRTDSCDKIINASFLVCASIKNEFCVFVPNQYKCQTQIPTTCGFSQSSKQCKRMKTVSCIWNMEEEICIYSEESAYLTCSQVNQRSGNQRSCMNVEVSGQQCIYEDEQCVLFVGKENSNNCLDTINKNACIHQTISDCQWVEQVYKIKKYQYQDEEEVIQGECRPITNLNQISCSQNISYTACLKISKAGEHCIWKDFKCQSINQQVLYTPNELNFININACGLVNNGDIVRYDEMFKKCVIIENPNELTCNPLILGINKDACLSIKTQPCIWNSIQKRCQYVDILMESQLCERPNWNVISCSYLNIDQPCGYSINGCQLVDINSITCTYAGLNKFACLNIQKYPCIWKQNDQNDNYYCDDYIPYTSCQLIPTNVNSKVCQLVDQDACYYDINNNKCENINISMTNCDTLGLNIIACIEIDGCVFQDFCQSVKKQIYKCEEYPIANYKVCKNAIDSCKFNELTYGCSQANEELCDAKGLSNQGCNLSNCTLLNNQCLCYNLIDKDCNLINNIELCKSSDHCKFQQNQCIWKSCEDQSSKECDGQYINQVYCYLNTSQQCKSAKQCEDIQNPKTQMCPQINYKQCIFNSELNQCQLLNCEILNQSKCLSYPEYCKFEQSCIQIGCNDMKETQCNSNLCNWNSDLKICDVQVLCSTVLHEIQCKQNKYNNKNCQWITLNGKSFCTDTPCRFLPNPNQCNGIQIHKETCVQLTDDTCVSCDEISSSCICLQNKDYCDYNFKEMKCVSKICEQSKDICPQSHCVSINSTCIQQCQYIQHEESCKKRNDCIFNNTYCKVNEPNKDGNLPDVKINQKYGELVELLLLNMLILYF